MLHKLDIHIVDHCNLKCKSCTHFASLADEFYLDVDEYERDLTRISTLARQGGGKGLNEIYLIGGEPLLHPKLTEFFPITRNLFRDTKIIIITNGILLGEQDENFWKACRRSSIEIWVTAYTLNIDYDAITQKAKEFDVFVGYIATDRDEQGRKPWTKFTIDPEGKQYWVEAFSHCAISQCVALKHGRLYTCPIAAHIEYFNKTFNTNLELCEHDSIDIYKVDSAKAITDAMVKPIPFCRYCKTKEYQPCFWAPTKKDINEWI